LAVGCFVVGPSVVGTAVGLAVGCLVVDPFVIGNAVGLAVNCFVVGPSVVGGAVGLAVGWGARVSTTTLQTPLEQVLPSVGPFSHNVPSQKEECCANKCFLLVQTLARKNLFTHTNAQT
jgi:hypothetical protein